MGFISILLFLIIVLFIIMIKFVIDGVREKDWKRSIVSIFIFSIIITIMYFGLIKFITSM